MTGVAPGTYYVLAYRNDNKPGIGVYTRYTVNCQQATQGGQFSTPAPACAANQARWFRTRCDALPLRHLGASDSEA
jgi:hypothetical protein